MRDENPERLAEQLLDATLAQYRSAEPRWGLEERILANLRTLPPSPQRIWWKWLPVLAAAAIVLAVALTTQMLRQTRPPERAVSMLATNLEKKQETRLSDEARLKSNHPRPQSRGTQITMQSAAALAARRELPAASLARSVATASETITRQLGAQSAADLRIEELRISDFSLKEIVINKNEQDE